MGFFRGALLLFVGSLLIVSLFAGNLLWTLSLSLEYENVQPALISSVKDILGEQEDVKAQIEEGLAVLEEYCDGGEEYIVDYEGQTFTIPCDMVNSTVDEVLEEGANEFLSDTISDSYYQEYDCEFWDCLEKTGSPAFLVSEKARSYWDQKFYFVTMISLILIVLIFFLVERKLNFPITIGSLVILSALPFMKITPFFSFLDETYLQFVTIFISKSYTVFLTMFIIGAILLILGILLYTVFAGTKLAGWLKERSSKKKEDSKDAGKLASVKKDPVKVEKVVKQPAVKK